MAEVKPVDLKSLYEDFDLAKLLDFAKLCENAERFEDMSDVMKQIVIKSAETKTALTDEHQSLMSVAFKNVVGDLRKAMRKLEMEQDADYADLQKTYKARIIQQVKDQCTGVINLLTDHLLDKEFVAKHNASWEAAKVKHANDENVKKAEESKKEAIVQTKFTEKLDETTTDKLEAQTFYLKMLGDYWRYLSEAAPSDNSKDAAHNNYENAWKMAKSFMAPTHPTRLGLALNSSVFVQEIKKDTKTAQKIAKEAFESAIQSLDTLNDSSYKDSTLIMQLLRDNLTIWQESKNEEDVAYD